MTRKAKVALIAPRIITARDQVKRAQPPLGLACLAAVLEEKGHEIVIIDSSAEGYENVNQLIHDADLLTYGLNDEIVVRRIADFSPDLIGISVLFSAQAKCGFELASAVKTALPETPIVLGGIHASRLYERILQQEKTIDFILTGESDFTFTELVEKIVAQTNYLDVPGLAYRDDDGIVINPQGSIIEDLGVLPLPAWHLLKMEKYFEIGMPHNPFVKSGRVGCIMTSRGCPQRCYFCSSSGYFGHRYRPISAPKVINMVRYLVENFNIKEIQIEDDTFTLIHQRVVDICNGIKKFGLRITLPNGIRADVPKSHDKRLQMFKAMRAAGCEQIAISVEHGDQDFLDKVIGKRLDLSETIATCDLAHKADMLVHANFMMGFPFETEEQRNRTVEFSKKLPADSYSVSLAAPLPGTGLWDIVEKNGLFMDNFDINRILYSHVNIKPHDISATDLQELVIKLNRELNEEGQRRNPASNEKYKLFKGKNSHDDRKYQHLVKDGE